jgi:hypothetical protein
MTNPNPAGGFRFHPRHLAIIVAFFALCVGLLLPVAGKLDALGVLDLVMMLLVAAPWLLALLILVFGRKSPVKSWAAPLLLSLSAPVLVIYHDWMVLASWQRMGTVSNPLVTLAINIVLIGLFTFCVVEMSPRRCPECRGWAMIPLQGPWGPFLRMPSTRWCASCGAKYWRTSEKEWRKERRRTWLEVDQDGTRLAVGKQERRFDPDSRVYSPRISTMVTPLATLPDDNTPAD